MASDTAAESAPEAAAASPEQLLADAENAFATGDFEQVRKLTQQVLSAPSLKPELRTGAETLLRQVSLDRVQVGLFLACVALFLYTWFTYV